MSEQILQNDLFSSTVSLLDKYTCYNLGATTINDLIKSGNLYVDSSKNKSFGKKPDVLVVDKDKRCVVFIECKKPSEFKTEKDKQKAINQEIDVAKDIGAKIFIATDTNEFIWLNPLTKNKILDGDGNELKEEFKPKENQGKLIQTINNLMFSLSDKNDRMQKFEDLDPTDLAVKIAGIMKRMTFASSKMALYTFVEVFLFKYLSDIGILKAHSSFDSIYSLYKDETYTDADVLRKYFDSPRSTMEKFFPEGPDGTSIINGQVFHVSENPDENGHYISEDNTDQTFKNILKEFAKYEKEHGKFINISKDFKSKLFETFMKNSDDKADMGQFFTPLKVVSEMVEMVDIKAGDKICDPACGVGKFLLEAVSANQDIFDMYEVRNKMLNKGVNLYGFEKTMSDRDDITTILAKANTVIYFSNLYKENNDADSIKLISEELLNRTYLSSKQQLGTLAHLEENKYDVIFANPPYYRDAQITKLATNTGLYSCAGQGIEALFLEWIIRSLKETGTANVIIPEGILTNIGNTKLKQFVIDNCDIKAIISLPINTFFNTPKKTYILCLQKKAKKNIGKIQEGKVFLYLCSSIGETLDAYRLDIEENDLHEAIIKFNNYRIIKDKDNIPEPYKSSFENDKRMKLIDIGDFLPEKNWNIDNFWNDEEKIELGMKKEVININAKDLQMFIDETINSLEEYRDSLNEDENSINSATIIGRSIPAKECFCYLSGNQGLSTKLIHYQKNSNTDCVVLSSSLLDETSMGSIASNTTLPNGKKLKLFEAKEGIVISRNGYAGAMSYIPPGKYTLTDHAYIIYIKDDCPFEIDLRWFTKKFEKEVKKSGLTTNSGNQTWSIIKFMNNFTFDIPNKESQKQELEKLIKTEQTKKEIISKLEELLRYKS